MSKLSLVATITVKKESVENVKTEMIKLITPTRKEYGCIEYNLHQDNNDPAVFIFYETWESPACLKSHMNTEHFKNYVNATGRLVEKLDVHKMTRIE